MIMFKFYVNIILQLENRSKSAPTGTTDATGSIAHALKSLLIEERASSQEFFENCEHVAAQSRVTGSTSDGT